MFDLRFRFRGCRGAQGRQAVDEVTLRYRVLATEQSSRVPLVAGPARTLPVGSWGGAAAFGERPPRVLGGNLSVSETLLLP